MPVPKSKQAAWQKKQVRIRLSHVVRNPTADRYPVLPDEGNAALTERDPWMTVDATVKGTMAVHKGKNGEGHLRYALTHAPSGLLLTHTRSHEDTTRIAEYLLANHLDAMAQLDPKRIRGLIPAWVRDWIRRCQRAGHWLEPE